MKKSFIFLGLLATTVTVNAQLKVSNNGNVVCNNATWTVKDSLSFYGGASITVKSGSTMLLTNDAVLDNIKIVLEPGSTLNVSSGGILRFREDSDFTVPVGAIFNLDYGAIVNL